MGYSTVIVIDNDNLNAIESDPHFGKRLVAAIRQLHSSKNVKVSAYDGENSYTGATIVLRHHRDRPVTIRFSEGTAQALD